MIVKQELVNKVKDYFNLNIYETKVWLALISRGIASAGEIAEISGVPRSRTYDVLEGLEKRGFAIAKIGKPVKYLAVKPVVVIEKLKSNAVHELNEKLKMLSNLKSTREYTELEELHSVSLKPVKQNDISGVLRGKSNISSYLSGSIENAKSEITVCMPAEDVSGKSRLFSNIFNKANQKNVKLNIVLNGSQKEIGEISQKHNIKAIKTNINSKFIIIDQKEIVFMLPQQLGGEDVALWFDSDFFANSISSLFYSAIKSEKNKRK